VLLAVSLGAAVGVAGAAAAGTPPVALEVAGLAIMWLGLALRVWAVAVLGRAFRTTVEVDPGQAVVSTGPYRWIRHPAYAGLLLIVAGFGLAADSPLALAVCLVLPPPAIVRRIQVEEAELDRVLGDRYRVYRDRTARLLPRVW
jgi:protein-S-isoprenylcysteine O-methyltransferase Ste14